MYDRKKRMQRTALDFIVGLVGMVLLALALNYVQTGLSVQRQQDNSLTKLSIAQQRLEQNALEAEENLATYDAFGQAKIDTVAWYLDQHPDTADANGFAQQWGLTSFYVLDGSGKAAGVAPDFAGEAFGGLLTGGKAVTVDGLRYYAAPKTGSGWYVGGRDFSAEEAKLTELRSLTHALDTIKVGVNGYIFAVDQNGTLAYHPDSTLMGRSAAEAGLDPAKYPAGFNGWLGLNGTKDYCISRQWGDYLLAAVIPESELLEYNHQLVGLLVAVFAVICILLIAYALILRGDAAKHPQTPDRYWKLGKKLYLDTSIAGKLRNIALVGLAAVFLISFYVQTLSALSRQSAVSDTKLEAVQSILDNNADRIEKMTNEYSDEYAQRAKNIAYTLALDPALVNDGSLTEMAEKAQIRMINVFDRRGRMEATSSVYKDFVLSTEEDSQSYALWDVVKGYVDVLVQDAQMDDAGNYTQYVGVTRQDADGMVELGLSPQRLQGRLKTTELDYVLRSIAVENGGYLFAVDKETGKFLSYPKEKYIGRASADYGLKAAALRDEYTGYQTVDGEECLVTCLENGNAYIYVSVPTSGIFSARVQVSLVVTVVSLVVMLLIAAFLLFGGKPEESEGTAEKTEAKPETQAEPQKRFFAQNGPGGKTRLVQSAASRWAGVGQPWNELTPEQKLGKLMKGLLSVTALALVIYLWISHGTMEKGSILAYILGTEWERGVNLFSLTYIAIVVLEVLVISAIVRKVLLNVTQRFGARGETIGRLLDSFIKYASIIGAAFHCLNFVGIDSATLMTSAGILTLVVGLGAQSLISDILAGVFIVFEGEFRVGDIVTIGDWRGTVLEIGIRTTKIESAGSDIKIFNNSAISGVINMTKQYSYAFVDVGIEYDESLEHVESVLRKELPQMKQRLTAIKGGPFYKGVSSLGDSSVNVRIVAECKESDRVQLTRDMNREMKLIFDHNNISIPFPQVVINQPVVHEKATRAEKKQAEAFVEEQKEMSKDIHVRDDG